MIPVLGKLKLFITEDTDIYKGYALQINYDFIKKYYPAIDNYQFIQPNHKIKEKILLDIFKIIAAYDHSNQFQRIEIESYILHLLYTLLSNTLDKKTNLNLQTLHDIRMTQYIDLHYNEDLSIDNIAQHFNISTGYLSRYFKSHLNVTVKEYLIAVRLKKARQDVLFSNYTILEIAYLHGIPNLKSFINAFKKVYHDTPAKYREKVRK